MRTLTSSITSLKTNDPGRIHVEKNDFDSEFYERVSTQQHVLKKLLEQNRKDTWDSRFDFLMFLFTFSNGTPQVQMAASICAKVSGGVFFSILIGLNILFVYPILILELFFGSFTKFTFGQIWRMAPLFHGFGITYIFLYVGFLLMTSLNTAHSFVYAIKAFKRPWFHCPTEFKNLSGRYDTECISPQHDNIMNYCVRSPLILSFNCSRYPDKPVQFVALYYYWQKFCDPSTEQTQFLRDSVISHAVVWILTFVFLYKGRNFISKLVFLSALFMICNVILLIYFILHTKVDTTKSVLKTLFAIHPEKFQYKVVQTIFWFVLYKTPVGFPNIYTTSSAYYNLKILDPIKYARLLLIFGDLYLLGIVMLLNFIDHYLSELYRVPTNSLFLVEERGICFATIPEYIANTNIKAFLSLLYFFLLSVNLLSNHVNTVQICLLNVFDYFPRYKEFKAQVIFPFCLSMWIMGIPLYQKSAVYCIQSEFMFLLTTCGSVFCFVLEVWIYIAFYGIPRINNDFLYAFGRFPPLIMRIAWVFIPMLSIFFASIRVYEKKIDDVFCKGFERAVTTYYSLLVFIVILGAVIKFLKAFSKNNIKSIMKPTLLWGPPNKEYRIERKIKGNALQPTKDSSNLIIHESGKLSNKKSADDDSILKLDDHTIENLYARNYYLDLN